MNEEELHADIDMVARVCRDWPANSLFFKNYRDDIQAAARRLLPILETPGRFASRDADAVRTLRDVGEHVRCLARHPLFFPEIFHGVRLNADGSSSPLKWYDVIHLRAAGLLGLEDRPGLLEIYERLAEFRGSEPLRVAEVGSAGGRGSTRWGGEFIKARGGGRLYCIDPWEGWWYLVFLANMHILELEDVVTPIRMGSIEAAALFQDESLDAVFLDGSHFYHDVLADIDAYLPKVRKGGYLFGHDLHDLPSRFNRQELIDVSSVNNIDVTYTNGDAVSTRANVHPGVILAVQDRFGDDVEVMKGGVVWAKRIV